MKKIITLLVALFFSSSMLAEDAKTYTQFDTFRFSVSGEDTKKLTKNMRKHIKKYHGEGPYKAKIYNIATGVDVGQYVWVMGPLTFAEADARPENKKHDDDWADNIGPYLASGEHGEFWRYEEGLVIDNMAKDAGEPKLWNTRFLSVNPGQGERINGLMKQIKDTLDKIGKVKHWAVMDNQLTQGILNGRHLMTISAMDSWAEFDEDWKFEEQFEGLHGKDSFKKFLSDYNEIFTNSWEEVLMINKDMSNM